MHEESGKDDAKCEPTRGEQRREFKPKRHKSYILVSWSITSRDREAL